MAQLSEQYFIILITNYQKNAHNHFLTVVAIIKFSNYRYFVFPLLPLLLSPNLNKIFNKEFNVKLHCYKNI